MKRIEGKFNLYKQHLNALFDRNNFNHRHTKRSERFISFYLYHFFLNFDLLSSRILKKCKRKNEEKLYSNMS